MDEIFERASRAWNAMEGFRSERNRSKRYVFGDQWLDTVEVEDGRRISERQFIIEQGQTPMKNNLLRRILRNVVGAYRANYKSPGECFSMNRMEQLLPRLLEEFLISGLTVVRISGLGSADGHCIRPVTPDNFFFHSDGYDPRGWDVDMIGEIHCVSFSSLLSKLCRNRDDYKRLCSIYADRRESNLPCKVMEVWYRDSEIWGLAHSRKKAILKRMPMKRIEDIPDIDRCSVKSFTVSGWRCAWYAHDGTLLCDDLIAASHPYVWKAYPFLDGEVHSYISDIIDQQKYVNHLITLYDFIMKSSAKGVLLFPDESLPRGMSLQEVANEWSRFNGVIPYRAQPGVPLPTQVSGNSANIGITQLLKIEMQMLEDISGVSPTLQGKLENTTSSGTLFAQQNQAAMTSLLDVIRSFEEFASDIAAKIHP